ncbi:MAG: hypothetical protein WD431_19110 [Cyclobacteriaceae bacterium]
MKSCAGAYRYVIGGLEQDGEVKGPERSYTSEFRQYDPIVGRWLSTDPLQKKYPDLSPYNYRSGKQDQIFGL